MAFSYEEAAAHLQRALEQGRLGHAYLISGPSQSGKTKLTETIAALLVECPMKEVSSHEDIHRVAPESKSRRIVVEQIRDLDHTIHQKAMRGRRKVAIIHDADRLQPQAANAFLKTLEEPPSESHIFLLSSQPEMLMDTIISRCIEVPLRAVKSSGPGEAEERLFEDISKILPKLTQAGVREAMLFTRSFQTVLSTLKTQIQEMHDDEFSREKDLYKQNTDGTWLKEREEQIQARADAAIQKERGKLLHFVSSLFGTALRFQEDPQTPLPSKFTEAIHFLSGHFTSHELILKMETVDDLAQALERNVNEALALEAGFLRVFAPLK